MDNQSKTINRLPVTRKALYKDILRNRWRTLLACSSLMLLFLLPLLTASLIKDYMVLNLLSDAEYFSNGLFTEIGAIRFRSINFIFLLVNSLCIIVLFVGFCGIFRIFRQLTWSEGISFWSDFKKGILQNIWLFLRYSLLVVLLYFVTWSLIYFANNLLFAFISLGLATFVFIPLIVLGMYYSVIYDSTLRQRLNNVTLLYIKNTPFILGVSLLFEAFFFIEIIPAVYFIVKLIILLLSFFLIFPLIILYGSLVTAHIFDKDININHHKDIYRKGLY